MSGKAVNPSPYLVAAEVSLRGAPVLGRADRRGGPVVPALQPLLPRRGRTAGRARGRGRQPHRLPVGAAVHAAAGRRRPVCPPLAGRSVVRRRDLRQRHGVWRYVYRAVDQNGQVIVVLVSARRDAGAARRFFSRALSALKVTPSEVVTDAAAISPAVLDELVPSAWHHLKRYANNPIEADHSQLKHRLKPMRGLRTDRTAQVIITGHAFVQNLCRAHYELGLDVPPASRSPRRSPNSPWRSDVETDPGSARRPIRERNSAPAGPTRSCPPHHRFGHPRRDGWWLPR